MGLITWTNQRGNMPKTRRATLNLHEDELKGRYFWTIRKQHSDLFMQVSLRERVVIWPFYRNHGQEDVSSYKSQTREDVQETLDHVVAKWRETACTQRKVVDSWQRAEDSWNGTSTEDEIAAVLTARANIEETVKRRGKA